MWAHPKAFRCFSVLLPASIKQYCTTGTSSCLVLHVSLSNGRGAAGSGTWGQPSVAALTNCCTFRSDKSWECTYTVLLRKARHPQALLTFEILVWFQKPLLNFAFLLPLFIAKRWVWNKQKRMANLSFPPSVRALHPWYPQYPSQQHLLLKAAPLVQGDSWSPPSQLSWEKGSHLFFLSERVLQVYRKPL